MPNCETRYFGAVSFDELSAVAFPVGLPGFAHCRRFLPLEEPSHSPLIFLQSLEDPQLCFLALPIAAVDPAYALKMCAEDLALIALPEMPETGRNVECIVIVAVGEDRIPTANLLAPVVINLTTRLAVQAVRDDLSYSSRFPLLPLEAALPCL